MSRDGEVEIVWNEGTIAQWGGLFAKLPRSTLTQSFGYAQAMAKTFGALPRLGVIHAAGAPIGLVQVLERRHLRIFVRRELHRGPLWFEEPPEPATLAATLRLLRRECPRGALTRFSFLPELAAGEANAALMAEAGFQRSGPGYRTVQLDLAQPLERLRAGFARDWRQRLKGAEKAGLVLDFDHQARNLPWLVRQEHEQARHKHYRQMSGRLTVRLRNALVAGDGVLLAAALADGKPVAAALSLGHGRAATYQLGWADARGRETNAMRLVLWGMIGRLRERGVLAFDLGGINPESAPGVSEFKLGTGGQRVETLGLFG